MAISVDIGIFAHDEEASIVALIADLADQSVIADPDVDLRLHLLANGCTDATVPRARAALADLPSELSARVVLHDLPEGGKSRTGHRFIHHLSRPGADLLGFMDGDIRLPQSDTLSRMIAELRARPELQAFTSRPVKDVVHFGLKVGMAARLIALGGDGLTDFRKSICGQLFMLRAPMARRIGLPAGLPVEDGFIRAMVLTDLLSAPEDLNRIDGDAGIFHVYESIRTPGALIRHQTRIVTGSAVNAALFGHLRRTGTTAEDVHAALMEAAADPDWLPRVLDRTLPRWPYGFVPGEFLVKRLRARRGRALGARQLLVLAAGLGLDAVVYVLASWRMFRRGGAHHW